MRDHAIDIGRRLKFIRQSKGLSLDEAAKLTDVSKPALAQIERDISSPTINTLWKVSKGLKIPLSYLLQEQKDAVELIDYTTMEPIVEHDQLMQAYPIFPYDPTRNVEIFYIKFSVGCKHASQKHLDGVEEYLFVIKGQLQLVVDNQEIIMKERQAIRFHADIPHQYLNPYDEDCAVYNMIFYPIK